MRAYIDAGFEARYAQDNACRLLKKPEIQEYIRMAMSQIEADARGSFKWKRDKLIKVVEVCIPDDAEFAIQFDTPSGVKAIAELNKMDGDYADFKRGQELPSDKDIEDAKELLSRAVKAHEKEY